MDVTDFYNKGVKTPIGNEYTIAPHNVLWPIALNAISTNVQGHINQTPGYAGSETISSRWTLTSASNVFLMV